jgi:tryptophan synthase beta chain
VNVFGTKIPKKFYNIQSILEIPPPKGENIKILPKIFPKEFLKQEMCQDKFVPIPEEVREILSQHRPTPLVRATRLEKHLKLPENIQIFYKRGDVSPTGSHKLNTAIMQAFLAKNEGFKRLTTETGAGQWGSALSFACNKMGLDCTVYMVRCSYEFKPYRKVLMNLFGAEILSSPSNKTEFGKKIRKKIPNTPGSLGISIAEAIEDAEKHEDTAYALGSVLNSVLMHQTIIGLEAKDQFKEFGIYPDVMVGCIGGGSNYGGFIIPFVEDAMKNRKTEFIAVEPSVCASVTKGKYRYDYGDTAKQTPLIKMHTLGYDFVPPAIHAGGLRYHGMAPIICALAKKGMITTRIYDQNEIFEAGRIFAKTEGILPAPETCHAIRATMDRALEAKENKEEKIIAVNFSGHGFFDLKGYEDFMEGKL